MILDRYLVAGLGGMFSISPSDWRRREAGWGLLEAWMGGRGWSGLWICSCPGD